MAVSTLVDVTQGLRQGCVLSPLLFNVFFATAIHAVLVRVSEDPEIVRDLVHLEEDLGEDGVNVEPLACVRRSVCGLLYTDDAGLASKSAEALRRYDRHYDRFRSRRPHRVRKENGDNAVSDTQPGNPDLTARRRSSGPEVYADNAVFVPGRPYRRTRRHNARG